MTTLSESEDFTGVTSKQTLQELAVTSVDSFLSQLLSGYIWRKGSDL